MADVMVVEPSGAEQRLPQVVEEAAAPREVPRVTVRTPQIHWHGKSPVFAIDFHPHFGPLCATGGLEPDGTGGVHLWIVNDSTGESAEKAPVSFVQDLQGHEKAVNCLRFCPKGDLLASAGVEGCVVIWRRTHVAPSPAAALAGHEKWEYMTMLRAQTLDVVDLSWSPSCTQLATASVDNTAAVFNIAPNKDKVAASIRGHDHFALGVAWDPKEEYILTVSSDGSCRFHTSKSGRWKADARAAHIACKMEFPNKKSIKPPGAAEGEAKVSKEFKMFLDDSMAAHRRRAAWSPDGLFAVVPAGLYQSSAACAPYYVSHVIARRNPTKSFALLPSGRKPSIAVKFCPTLFKLSRHGGKEAVGEGVPTPEKLFATPLKGSQAAQDTQSGFNMPYKMIFAVATTNSILVYDTEQMHTPFMYVAGIHFDALTDIAWSKDGLNLIATSKDGYCSLIDFAPGELGEPVEPDMLPTVVAKNSMPGKSIDLSIKDPEDEAAAAAGPREETAAQKIAEMVAAPAPLPELVEFKVGDRVSARWMGGQWYDGTITKVNEPEAKEPKEGEENAAMELIDLEAAVKARTYAVKYDDGDFEGAVPHELIKPLEDKRARKRRIVPQVVKSIDDLAALQEVAAQASGAAESGVKVAAHAPSSAPADATGTLPAEHVPAETSGQGEGDSMMPHDDAAAAPVSSAAHQPAAESAPVPEAAPKKRRIIPVTVTAAP